MKLKQHINIRRFAIVGFLIFSFLVFQQCSSTKTASSVEDYTKIERLKNTYETALRPIMLKSCTPCHFPERGRKTMLDTFEATKTHISAIIARVQLPSEDAKYMPFKNKRPALTQEEIAAFIAWQKDLR